MFGENIEIIKTTFNSYYDTGKYFLLLLISIIYLFMVEKNSNKRTFLIGYSCLAVFIIINPLFNKIINPFINSNVYNRLYWILPSGIIMAYTSVLIIKNIDKSYKKVIVLCALFLLIIFSGNFIYNKQNFYVTENLYKIPDEYLEVSKIIKDIPIYPKKAIVSTDLVAYVRLIADDTLLAYSRRPNGYKDYPIVGFYEAGDVKTLTMLCKEKDVNIIVYDRNILLTISPIYFGYDYYTSTDRYDIYVLKQ